MVRVLSRPIKIAGLLALVVIAGCVVLLMVEWPFKREMIVEALQEKFSSTVELKAFHETYFPPGCVAEGVSFSRNRDQGARPIATIEKLSIQGAYWEFFSRPSRVRRVTIEGLRMFVSPQTERGGDMPRAAGGKQSAVIIDQIVADGAVVEFASDKPGAEPVKFEIHQLTLQSVADDRPMSFHAALLNPKPPGEIRTDGEFGPLQAQNLGQTALSGSYEFQNADLSVFHGIAGTLSSSGKFKGILQHIEIEGTTDTPDFQITRSHHAVDLKTKFQGIVNGLDGEVSLPSVEAQFNRTSLVSRVDVANKEASGGKTISVDAAEQQGRIQDWLELLAHADRPALNGTMNFKAQVTVPPGKGSLIERVKLLGDFGIADASLAQPASQKKIDNLSQVGQGEKENDDPAGVVEDLKGHVALDRTVATFADLSFSVPGAQAHVHGTYGLLTQHIDLHGSLQLENKLSKGEKGMKSVLIKSLEPFLKKKKAGEIVPIRIGGTFKHPSYGLVVVP